MNAPVIPAPKASGALIILALSAAAGIVFFHLACAWFGFSQYRDQHLGTALVYARDGIDLLRRVIVGFNANNAPTPLEFPLWQSAASLPLRWFGGWFGWANIVSLLFFFTAVYPVQRLGARLGGTTVGWWAVALLLVQPLVWVNAGLAATDGTCIAAAIWFFYCGTHALQNPGRLAWTAGTALSGALAADELGAFLSDWGILFVPCSLDSSILAGEMYRTYLRRNGGAKRVLPEFLIGAHAACHTGRLLARDRGYYCDYFKDLTVIEPEKTQGG